MLKEPENSTAILPFVKEMQPQLPTSASTEDLEVNAAPRTFTFVIPGSGRRLVVQAVDELDVGRSDPAHGFEPDLDLTPDNGAQHGVSRHHAVIRIASDGPILTDLDSTNGTLLNNYRLPPNLPYVIKNGDEIRFGHLLVHVFFEM